MRQQSRTAHLRLAKVHFGMRTATRQLRDAQSLAVARERELRAAVQARQGGRERVWPHAVEEAGNADAVGLVHQAGQDLSQVAERLVENPYPPSAGSAAP